MISLEKTKENQSLPECPDKPTVFFAESCGWRTLAASVQGAGHQRNGQLCQDAHCCRILPPSLLIASIADGAGSASLAEVGATTAAQAAVTAIDLPEDSWSPEEPTDEFWRTCLVDACLAAQKAVHEAATAHDTDIRELASTLILVVATPTQVAAIQIGDGAVVIDDEAGEMLALTTPQSGEYINETVFLLSPGAIEQAQITIWNGAIAHLALFTDGLQMLALNMPDETPHPPFFLPLFRFAATASGETSSQQLASFLSSERIATRTHDDTTLLLATRIQD